MMARFSQRHIPREKAEENVNQDRLFDRKQKDNDRQSAKEWLLDWLADGSWHPLDEIFTRAEAHGYTKSALQQAQQRNKDKIESERRLFGPEQRVYWRLKPAPTK
jgi:hypothetical protein